MKFRELLRSVFEDPPHISSGGDDPGETDAALDEEASVPHAGDHDEPEPKPPSWVFGGRR